MLKFFFCAVIAALAHAVVANDAPERFDNPSDVIIMGLFNMSQRPLEGGIAFWSDDGTATASVHFFGFPRTGSPYSYSINEFALPELSVCTESGDVLNPYHGQNNATTWAGKKIGDLSGKHGKVDDSFYQCEYEDPYLSLRKTIPVKGLHDPSYIGDRSLVVSDKDGFDFGCCNLVPFKRLGKMVDMNGEKVPEEFYSMVMEARVPI